jgi:hypothetical protein
MVLTGDSMSLLTPCPDRRGQKIRKNVKSIVGISPTIV